MKDLVKRASPRASASRQQTRKTEDGESYVRNYYGQHVQAFSAGDRQCERGLRAQNRLEWDSTRSEGQLNGLGRAQK